MFLKSNNENLDLHLLKMLSNLDIRNHSPPSTSLLADLGARAEPLGEGAL
jgi:hypothetical protein